MKISELTKPKIWAYYGNSYSSPLKINRKLAVMAKLIHVKCWIIWIISNLSHDQSNLPHPFSIRKRDIWLCPDIWRKKESKKHIFPWIRKSFACLYFREIWDAITVISKVINRVSMAVGTMFDMIHILICLISWIAILSISSYFLAIT